MVPDPLGDASPRSETVLDALGDPDCRTILERVGEPMTATEVAEACEVSRSTAYRKLDLLSDASLVDERVEIGSDGGRRTRYVVDFEAIEVARDDDRSLTVTVERETRTTEERLSDLWSEVRRET